MKAGRELDAEIAAKVFGDKIWICNYSDATDDWGIYKDNFNAEFLTRQEAETFAQTKGRKAAQPKWYKGASVFPSPALTRYSTDIESAWFVFEKFKRLDNHDYGDISITWGNYGPDTTPKGPCGQMVYPAALAWLCRIEKNGDLFTAFAETAPHAICLAALKALSAPPATKGGTE